MQTVADNMLNENMTVSSKRPILEMKNIEKGFPGVKALNGVSFDLRAGEIHALLGENGSGKSTLIKILSGIYEADAGEIYLDGNPVEITNSAAIQKLGVATVHQEINLIPNMDAASNMYLNWEPIKHHLIDFKKMYADAREVLERIGFDIDPRRMANLLSVAEMQLLEIAKSMSKKMRVLVLDEPTASLPAHEVEFLFNILKKLRDEGIGIIYVSHRLEEIELLADRVTIIRDGNHIVTCDKKDITIAEIIKSMVGREVHAMARDCDIVSEEVILHVENLTHGELYENITFDLKKGEILGIAGLVGSGRTELSNTLGGGLKPTCGNVKLMGREIRLNTPCNALSNGIALLPSERKIEGVSTLMSVRDNIIVSSMRHFSVGGLFTNRAADKFAGEYVEKLQIKTPSLRQKVGNLSGGNQQKVVLGKVLAHGSDILVFDEPTRGIDVGTRREIYTLISELSKQGKSIILSSSDLSELMQNCDRIITMYRGQVIDEFINDGLSMSELLRSVLGQPPDAASDDGVDDYLDKSIEAAEAQRAAPPSGEHRAAEPRQQSLVKTAKEKAKLDAAKAEAQKRKKRNQIFFNVLLWSVPIFTVLMILFFALQTDKFLAVRNLQNFSKQFGVLMIIACGQALALITRGIDMSIGAMMAWTSMVLAGVTVATGSFTLGLLAAIVAVLLFGVFNGVIIGGLGADAFIITLGMMYVCRGLALMANEGQPFTGLPSWFAVLSKGDIAGVPFIFLYAVIIAVLFQIVLTRTRAGRHITALGGNREGAIFSGVNVNLRVGTAYLLSACLAGMAGLIMASRMFSGQPNMGMSAHLEAITAAILGGISLAGGRGDIAGVVVGAVLLTTINNGMNLTGVATYTQDTVLGMVLIFALILDRMRQIAIEKTK